MRAGDQNALNELVALLYDELRRLAAFHLRAERAPHTLQTTALVHEVYLKLLQGSQRSFSDRVHFLAVASRVMRQILVDYARSRGTRKRGADEADSIAVVALNLGGDAQSGLDVAAPQVDLGSARCYRQGCRA